MFDGRNKANEYSYKCVGHDPVDPLTNVNVHMCMHIQQYEVRILKCDQIELEWPDEVNTIVFGEPIWVNSFYSKSCNGFYIAFPLHFIWMRLWIWAPPKTHRPLDCIILRGISFCVFIIFEHNSVIAVVSIL